MAYNKYIDGLKKDPAAPDFNELYSRIERQAVVRPRARLALAGALAVVLVVFSVYFFQARQTGGEMLMSYVFEKESIDGPLLDYVFKD